MSKQISDVMTGKGVKKYNDDNHENGTPCWQFINELTRFV